MGDGISLHANAPDLTASGGLPLTTGDPAASAGGCAAARLRSHAAQHEMHDDRRHQRDEQRRERKRVDVLPGRQREHVEGQVVVEDGVLDAEGTLLRARAKISQEPADDEADDDGDERRSARPIWRTRREAPSCTNSTMSMPSSGAVLGGHAAGDLDVAVDDGEEDGAEDGTQRQGRMVTRLQKTVRSATSPNQSQST